MIRHNLDVMHIEKNICDNILGTLLDIKGKTKGTESVHEHLHYMGIRDELPIKIWASGNKLIKPVARYTLSTSEKKGFHEFLKSIKFPDGHAANISRYVKENKISSLKSPRARGPRPLILAVENLEEISDSKLNNSTRSGSSDRVEEVTSGSDGGGACEEQRESEDEIESEDEETESEGKEVESESEEIEESKVLGQPSVVMALRVHDGRRWGVPRACVPRCLVVDVGFSNGFLTREQLAIIRRTFNVPYEHKFILPSLG
ncbi:UNVERIFIED_CONTAM: hypothetical protein Slati_0836600 [Sesamum latifolium]|uniref:Uncharacterized protein n=1 Tax=Sesamum latifolium TaxID=2727402 RepID=A0AAW2XM17_9LAMI